MRRLFGNCLFISGTQIGLQKFWATCFGRRERTHIKVYGEILSVKILRGDVAGFCLQRFWARAPMQKCAHIIERAHRAIRAPLFSDVYCAMRLGRRLRFKRRKLCPRIVCRGGAGFCLERFWAICFERKRARHTLMRVKSSS